LANYLTSGAQLVLIGLADNLPTKKIWDFVVGRNSSKVWTLHYRGRKPFTQVHQHRRQDASPIIRTHREGAEEQELDAPSEKPQMGVVFDQNRKIQFTAAAAQSSTT
jgi:hypothetical protein